MGQLQWAAKTLIHNNHSHLCLAVWMWLAGFAYQHEKFVGTKCADYKLGVEAVAELDMTDSAWLNQCQWQACSQRPYPAHQSCVACTIKRMCVWQGCISWYFVSSVGVKGTLFCSFNLAKVVQQQHEHTPKILSQIGGKWNVERNGMSIKCVWHVECWFVCCCFSCCCLLLFALLLLWLPFWLFSLCLCLC